MGTDAYSTVDVLLDDLLDVVVLDVCLTGIDDDAANQLGQADENLTAVQSFVSKYGVDIDNDARHFPWINGKAHIYS